MSSDQITPAGAISESARNYAIIIHILYLVGLINGVTTVVGVIIAYIKRGDYPDPADRSHFNAAITTFWIGLGVLVIGFITSFILIGFVIMAIGWLWYLYRAVIGLIRAMEYRPV